LVIFWEGLVLITAIFYRDIGELQFRKVVVESGSRRYVEIQLFFHKLHRFCGLPSLFSFRTFGQLTKVNRAEIKNYADTFMRLLIAHTPVPLYLPCALMAVRSSKSKSTDIFPIFRESEGPTYSTSYCRGDKSVRILLTVLRTVEEIITVFYCTRGHHMVSPDCILLYSSSTDLYLLYSPLYPAQKTQTWALRVTSLLSLQRRGERRATINEVLCGLRRPRTYVP